MATARDIKSAKALSARMAEVAQDVRDEVRALYEVETEDGPIRALFNDVRGQLLGDLTPDRFADVYAQTMVYGLLTARIAHPEEFKAEQSVSALKFDNEFLDAIYSRFRDDSDGVIDVDELGLNELAEQLADHRRRRAARRLRCRQPARRPGRLLLRGVPRPVRPRPAQGPRRLLHPAPGRPLHRQDRRRRSEVVRPATGRGRLDDLGRVRRDASRHRDPQAGQARRRGGLDVRPGQRHRHVPRRVDPTG